MFECLTVEGWRTSTLLPKGWMFKIPKPGVINFFNKEGVVMTSFEEMRELLKTSNQITLRDLQNLTILESTIKELYQINSRSSKEKLLVDKNQPDVLESDLDQSVSSNHLKPHCPEEPENIKTELVLPPGWIVKGKSLLSSSGVVYGSVKAAIIAMREQGGQEEVVQAILKLPCARGWSTRNLPLGWMIRGTPAKYYIIGPDGSFFESKAKAINHLISLGGSEKDKVLLDKFSEGGKRKSKKCKKCTGPLTEADINRSKTHLKKYAKHVNKKERSITGIPERKFLQEVLRSGASEKEAVPLREVLMTCGWKMEGLPSGWMGKSLSYSCYR